MENDKKLKSPKEIRRLVLDEVIREILDEQHEEIVRRSRERIEKIVAQATEENI